MSPGDRTAAVLPGVSLICTLYNEAGSVSEFLGSVFSMDVLPEEFVIVDGGSTDGTNDRITDFLRGRRTEVRVLHRIEPECNIRHTPGPVARGRNIAIGLAGGEIIAVTDAGCRLDPGWLGKLVAPLREHRDIDVAGGWYLPDARSAFESCVGRVWLTPPVAVDPGDFMPSSRSLAFRRGAWLKAGGYPEHTLLAEDTLFNLALRAGGCTFAYVPDAVVYWRVPHSLRAFARLAWRYGYGDGLNRIMPGNLAKVALKLSITAALAAATVFVHPALLAAAAIYLAALVSRHRPGSLLKPDFLASLPCMAGLKIVADASYMAGYLRGGSSPRPTPAGAGCGPEGKQ